MIKTAILIDGGFYRKRAAALWGEKTAEERAEELWTYCKHHLEETQEEKSLYRVLYYDCPPIANKIYHPLHKKTLNFEQSDMFQWANTFFSELMKKRKFALRMGVLSATQAHYNLRPDVLKRLLNGEKKLNHLQEKDFKLNLDQKGVDIKIGLDIASLSYKRLVDQIILISGDSDFVPAAKFARREGMDIVLDPMLSKIKEDLFEHIDGLTTQCDLMYNGVSKKYKTKRAEKT